MAGIKRKVASGSTEAVGKKQKTTEHKPSKLEEAAADEDAMQDEGFGGFEDEAGSHVAESRTNGVARNQTGSTNFKLDTSSAEAHAKQRALAKERKANKPNADAIQRSKKLWERLRLKSHVPKEERKELVTELFSIIEGRVRDFIFKHDSGRVIQCALKYANRQQRRSIAVELKADIRTLVESKYGKFLVAKMVVEGDQGIRDIVVPEFYGFVKRLINHPEASWVVDDIYRQIATSKQKATMLREWYGPEFALSNRSNNASTKDEKITADLAIILETNPEKRKPILQHLLQMINSLIQKKMTGFTMLHDAMLQYSLAVVPGSEEHTEFLEILKGDVESDVEKKQEGSTGGGDLFRNLAFTKSGSRLVCLALAYGSAKDRKVVLRCFRDTVELMALDQYAKMVLVVGLDVPDDTKMSSKAIFSELLGQNIEDETQRLDRLEGMVTHLHARLPVLYPLAGAAKWMVSDVEKVLLEEVHKIRESTSKKAPELRRKGLVEHLSEPLLELVAKRVDGLAKSSFGCQFITETLLEANAAPREAAMKAVVELAAGEPTSDGHLAQNAACGKMLKTLVMGGNFDMAVKRIKLVEPRLAFASVLYPVLKDHLVEWACSDSAFVVVALLESEDNDDATKAEIITALHKGRERLEMAVKSGKANVSAADSKNSKSVVGGKGNAGARILLEKLSAT